MNDSDKESKSELLNSPFLNVILFSVFWAIQIFVSKLGFVDGAKVIPFTVQSAIVSIIVLTIYALPKYFSEIKSLHKKVLLGILIANAIHFGLGGFLSNAGVALTSAINAGFLVQFSTVTTSLLAWVFLREKVTVPRVVMVALIMIGSFYLTTGGKLIVPHTGDLLILLGCLSWSTANVTIRKILKNNPVSGDAVSFLRPLAGLPLLLAFILFSPLYPDPVRQVFSYSLTSIISPLFVVLNGTFTALVWIFLNRTLKVATASYMTMMSSLTPVLVAILAIAFLKETVDAPKVMGILLIISATTVTQIQRVDKH